MVANRDRIPSTVELLELARSLYCDAFISVYVSPYNDSELADWKAYLKEEYGKPLKKLGVDVDGDM